jgi:TetR/AcrR family transcriptional regulator
MPPAKTSSAPLPRPAARVALLPTAPPVTPATPATPQPSRRASAKAARAELILDAARRLFAERGFKGATTGAIARAAGVTERTLFQYFPSKDALFAHVTDGAAAMFSARGGMARTAGLMQAEPAFTDWYRQLFENRLRDVARDPGSLRLVIGQAAQDEAFRAEFGSEWMASVWAPAVAAVRRFQQRGELRSDIDPERIARVLVSANLGYIITRHLLAPQAQWEDDKEIAATLALLLNGMAAKGSARPSLKRNQS